MPLSPTRTTLPNGAVVIAKPTTTTPAVAINIAVRAGSACDPAGREGTAWLLSRVLDRGTASRSAGDIAEELDSRGVTLTITVTRHLLSLVCTCLADDFEPVLGLLADIVEVHAGVKQAPPLHAGRSDGEDRDPAFARRGDHGIECHQNGDIATDPKRLRPTRDERTGGLKHS